MRVAKTLFSRDVNGPVRGDGVLRHVPIVGRQASERVAEYQMYNRGRVESALRKIPSMYPARSDLILRHVPILGRQASERVAEHERAVQARAAAFSEAIKHFTAMSSHVPDDWPALGSAQSRERARADELIQ